MVDIKVIWLSVAYIISSIALFLTMKATFNRKRLLFLFSPILIYWLAYSLALFIRPFYLINYGVRYEFTNLEQDYFDLSVLLPCIFTLAFCIGYTLGYKYIFKEIKLESINSKFLFTPKLYMSILTALISGLVISSLAILISNNTLGFDLGENRQNFLSLLPGSGYISLIILSPCYLIPYAYFISRKSGEKLSKIARLSASAGITINVLLTNRSALVSFAFLMLFIYVLTKKDFVFSLRVMAFVIVFPIIGIYLGISRALYNASLDIDMSFFLMFLSLTFDMHEMLWHSLATKFNYYLGMTWYEDFVYTFFPRAIFLNKPHIYGSSRLEEEVLGRSSDIIGLSTFPLGVYSETYLNFGILGMLFVPVALGILVSFFYKKTIVVITQGSCYNFNYYYLYIYFFMIFNPLGYMRSLGQFLSALFFYSVFFYFINLLMFLIVKFIRSLALKDS